MALRPSEEVRACHENHVLTAHIKKTIAKLVRLFSTLAEDRRVGFSYNEKGSKLAGRVSPHQS